MIIEIMLLEYILNQEKIQLFGDFYVQHITCFFNISVALQKIII